MSLTLDARENSPGKSRATALVTSVDNITLAGQVFLRVAKKWPRKFDLAYGTLYTFLKILGKHDIRSGHRVKKAGTYSGQI